MTFFCGFLEVKSGRPVYINPDDVRTVDEYAEKHEHRPAGGNATVTTVMVWPDRATIVFRDLSTIDVIGAPADVVAFMHGDVAMARPETYLPDPTTAGRPAIAVERTSQ